MLFLLSPKCLEIIAYRDCIDSTDLFQLENNLFMKKMSYLAVQIAKSAGLRNILVHDYNDIDRKILHGSIRDCLKDYHGYLTYLSKFLVSSEKSH